MGSKETPIQSAIMQYLFWKSKEKPLFYWRANNTPVPMSRLNKFTKKRDFTGFRPGGIKGIPDINCIYDGLYIGLEVKALDGTQSQDQKNIQELIERAGGVYKIVRSVDDVAKIIEGK